MPFLSENWKNHRIYGEDFDDPESGEPDFGPGFDEAIKPDFRDHPDWEKLIEEAEWREDR